MYSNFSLNGKSAVVTGGAGILGKHFCAGLAQSGANVAIVDKVPAQSFADELANTYGVKAVGITCDLRSPDSVREMTAQCLSTFGRIDILHNNAAGKSDSWQKFLQKFEEYDLETWQEIMSINLDTMFLVAQSIGREMKKSGGGSIIQTSSIYGVVGPDQSIYEGSNYEGFQINTPAVYSASKAAVVGLTKYLATYWAKDGIRVNTLTPGGVFSGQNDAFVAKYSARVPMGRMGEPDDLVGALIYLASDASRYVTGQNVIVDGGLTAW